MYHLVGSMSIGFQRQHGQPMRENAKLGGNGIYLHTKVKDLIDS
jgi:hypothetical protein